MRYDYMHPREQIVTIMRRVYGYGMTTTSGGNLSLLDDGGDLWITPAGVDKGTLSEGDIVRMRGEERLEGPYAPSSEYPFHRMIYERRPDIRAVVHAHPAALVAFSLVHEVPDTRIIPQAHAICGTVGYAPYAPPGTPELGKVVAEAFARGSDVVLLENHGVVAAGANLLEAFQRFETLDFCARTIINARTLGAVRSLDPEQIALAELGRNVALPEFEVTVRSTEERGLRRQMRDFVHRAYEQRLMTSTEGTLSARIEGDTFLISPYGVDRYYLEESDLVLVRGGRREEGRIPSRATNLHREIYAANREIRAIASAQSPGVTAFSVTGTEIDTGIIPESRIVLRNIPLISYGRQYGDERALAREINSRTPVVLIHNDAILACGAALVQAFDRLEVAEFSAQAILAARRVGTIARMGSGALAALEGMDTVKEGAKT